MLTPVWRSSLTAHPRHSSARAADRSQSAAFQASLLADSGHPPLHRLLPCPENSRNATGTPRRKTEAQLGRRDGVEGEATGDRRSYLILQPYICPYIRNSAPRSPSTMLVVAIIPLFLSQNSTTNRRCECRISLDERDTTTPPESLLHQGMSLRAINAQAIIS